MLPKRGKRDLSNDPNFATGPGHLAGQRAISNLSNPSQEEKAIAAETQNSSWQSVCNSSLHCSRVRAPEPCRLKIFAARALSEPVVPPASGISSVCRLSRYGAAPREWHQTK